MLAAHGCQLTAWGIHLAEPLACLAALRPLRVWARRLPIEHLLGQHPDVIGTQVADGRAKAPLRRPSLDRPDGLVDQPLHRLHGRAAALLTKLGLGDQVRQQLSLTGLCI